MSIPSVSRNAMYVTPLSASTEDKPLSTYDNIADSVHLSKNAKQQLLAAQSQTNRPEESNNKEGKESVQVSSSIGRLSRISGLQREEVAALYRSIERLTDE